MRQVKPESRQPTGQNAELVYCSPATTAAAAAAARVPGTRLPFEKLCRAHDQPTGPSDLLLGRRRSPLVVVEGGLLSRCKCLHKRRHKRSRPPLGFHPGLVKASASVGDANIASCPPPATSMPLGVPFERGSSDHLLRGETKSRHVRIKRCWVVWSLQRSYLSSCREVCLLLVRHCH